MITIGDSVEIDLRKSAADLVFDYIIDEREPAGAGSTTTQLAKGMQSPNPTQGGTMSEKASNINS